MSAPELVSSERVVELLPNPIVDLISELSGSDDPGDQALLAEFLRETAQKANAILFNRRRGEIIAQMPSGAFDEYREDDKKNPAG